MVHSKLNWEHGEAMLILDLICALLARVLTSAPTAGQYSCKETPRSLLRTETQLDRCSQTLKALNPNPRPK